MRPNRCHLPWAALSIRLIHSYLEKCMRSRGRNGRGRIQISHTQTHRETGREKNIFKKLFLLYIYISYFISHHPNCTPQFDQFDRDQFDRDRRRVLSMEPKSTLTADTIRSLLEARHADGRNKSSAPENDRNGSQNRKNPFCPQSSLAGNRCNLTARLHYLPRTGAISRRGCTTCAHLVQSRSKASLL